MDLPVKPPSSSKPVRKAVIAAAGFGTRFLPQTKAMPKEMLPIVDKPIIQYVVEELADAGIEDIIIVTGYHKRSIEDHFDQLGADLRDNLKTAGKINLLEGMNEISNLANFVYIRQKGPYGNATPILNTEHIIGDEPFIYTWGDDFVLANPSRFKQLIKTYEGVGGSVLTCLPAQTDEDYERYAFVTGNKVTSDALKINKIIEKPGKQNKVSNTVSVGGYLFDPKIFKYLEDEKNGLEKGQEFIFQPALQNMIADGHDVFGCLIKNGKFYDTGDKVEYLKTVVDFALLNQETKDDFSLYLRDKLSDL